MDGIWQISKAFTAATISFTFILLASSESDFAGQVRKVEDAFRKPEQDLTLRIGGNTQEEFKGQHQSGTGARPIITKPNDIRSTGLSRVYNVVVTYDLPADNTPDTPLWPIGKQWHKEDYAFSPSRRMILTISGAFTSVAGEAASSVYESKAPDFFDAVKATYTGLTFDQTAISEVVTPNNTDDLVTFSVVYEELIFGQASNSALDDPDIVAQSFKLTKSDSNDSNDPSALRDTIVNVAYSASINKDNTTDLKAKSASIRTWAIAKAATLSGVSSYSLINDAHSEDEDNNSITLNFTIEGTAGALTGTSAISLTIETEDIIDEGKIGVPAWTGDNMEKYIYRGPRTFTRTITAAGRVRGIKSSLRELISTPSISGLSVMELSTRNKFIPLLRGVNGTTSQVTDVRTAVTFEFYKLAQQPVITPGNSGGGSSTPSGGPTVR